MAGNKRDKKCFEEGNRVLSLLVLIACSCWSIFILPQIFNLSQNSPKKPSNLKLGNINDDVGGLRLRSDVVIRRVPGEESEPTKQRDSRRHRESLQTKLGAPIGCDRSHGLYDICSVNGPTVLDPTSSTFYIMGPAHSPIVEKVKPYPRKFEAQLMSGIGEVSIVSGPASPQCQAQHDAPALVFSAGGYTGNFFHEFNEGFIPLFVTVSTVFQDQVIIIVVSEAPDWWLVRYQDLLKVFTKVPIIALQNDTNVTHCFPSATIGLISHGSMSIDQNLLPNPKTIHHFRGLLDRAFSQNFTFYFNRKSALPKPRRPRLVFFSRGGGIGRAISNQDEVIKTIEGVGFHVVVLEPTGTEWLCESYALLSESHAMVGVHGAALTHLLFLRPGSIFVQVVPIGVDWAAEEYFGRVGRELKLDYFEYKIGVHESSLLEPYGKDNTLLRNARSLQKGWPADVMDVYLRKQNVNIDIVRFGAYMKKAYVKARKFMRKSRKRNYIYSDFL